ncbi:acetyl-CoA hydrolase/transferase C-terminal domain-containing protein [Mycobacterium sp. 1274756.6]|uniref:acetyl-CoA hydrolase/transferase C-terminal domain-containing protein n=1 Tax=Mycobacterium sp. 1274756.6 TaxID=1834076 RepID=UPI000B188258|nr:acetyl-CoA hydrolase/transferase C-terminal domain-containing protein [Mycobacterium sp. 1274756.6]
MLRRTLRSGYRIALGDGVGALRTLADGTDVCRTLSMAARERGGVSLILGWMPTAPHGLEADAFAEVISLMPGWGTRKLLPSPMVRAVPTSMAAIPGLLAGHLRPDVLITRMAEDGEGLRFCTEVSWQRAMVDAGVPVWAVLDRTAPVASAEKPIPVSQVKIVGIAACRPAEVPSVPPDPVHDELADRVLQWVPSGARIQCGPGQLGTALLRRTTVPLQIDTGLLTDAVVDLDRRGLLLGVPSATYLLGGQQLYRWADRRPVLRSIEHTHNINRLACDAPFIAVNTAVEIDRVGQINVEGIGNKVVGGIGGHPDYCSAARLHRDGLSIIAVPSRLHNRSPLVDHLSRPASTPAHDVEIIVTEHGYADLRGADWATRQKLITRLFDKAG